jgi:transposase InsO family protein
MNVHKNARCTPRGRSLAVQRVQHGERPAHVARGAGISRQTLRKWTRRAEAAGDGRPEALADRSSRPRRLARQLPRHQRRQILRSRRKRWSSLRIAQHYALAVSTVVSFLRRHGLNRLTRLEPPRPIQRYERRRPGTLVHLDVKKLGKIGRVGHRMHGDRTARVRGIGWEYVHVAIDDCTRVGYAEVLADEQGATTVGFLERACAWYAAHGVTIRRLLTDNGGNYRSDALAACCRRLKIRQQFTRPYRPQTNGKAERFIRTLLHEWAYAQAYGRSLYRTRALPQYLRFYNAERRHTALQFSTPLQRLAAKQ